MRESRNLDDLLDLRFRGDDVNPSLPNAPSGTAWKVSATYRHNRSSCCAHSIHHLEVTLDACVRLRGAHVAAGGRVVAHFRQRHRRARTKSPPPICGSRSWHINCVLIHAGSKSIHHRFLLCFIFNVLHFAGSRVPKLVRSPVEGDVGASTNPCQKFDKPDRAGRGRFHAMGAVCR